MQVIVKRTLPDCRCLPHHGPKSIQDLTGSHARPLKRPDGVELYVQDAPLPPGVTLVAVAVLLHSMTLHSGFLQPLIDHLVTNGKTMLSTVRHDSCLH